VLFEGDGGLLLQPIIRATIKRGHGNM